jgi:altronate dehydratase
MNVAIVISATDNVATLLESIDTGHTIHAGGSTVTAAEPIPRGHKIALRDIRAGDTVVKYGNPIGTASSNIAAGAHVHTHNVASARGRGDRAVSDPHADRSAKASRSTDTKEREALAERTRGDEARLAEPREP